MRQKEYYTYIMTNQRHTTLYVGITGDLPYRTYQHKNKVEKGFTKKYNINKLVYYEVFDNPDEAIAREKQIKAGSRKKKIELINRDNPKWRDLSEDFEADDG